MRLDDYAVHIPFLRRFARALTGSQEDGDHLVELVLEPLVCTKSSERGEVPAKLHLHRVFYKVWLQSEANLGAKTESVLDTGYRVRKLAPRERYAFLLNALENLTDDEISFVIDLDISDVIELLARAEVDISRELRTSILIIEDEPIIASDIEAIVGDMGHTVSGIAATQTSALDLTRDHEPGIIISDVKLADGSSGMDAVTDILKEYKIPVIFVTAFPESLLTGNKPEPAYLISKPFVPENLRAAISQVLFFEGE
ncbi:response regulator [Hellea sp.]|nr:response regulator [Hellea sp.]